jgi:hypothetical protein
MSRAGQTYEQIILALTAFKNSVNAQTEINANDKAAVIKLIDDQINTLSMHPQKTDQYKPVRHIDTGLSGVMSAFTTSVPTSASPASPTGAGGAGRSPVRGRAPGGFLGLDDAFASSNKPNSPITFIYRGFSSKQTNGMPTIPLNANEYPRILDAIQKKDITTINQIINPKKFKAILDRNGTYTIEKL